MSNRRNPFFVKYKSHSPNDTDELKRRFPGFIGSTFLRDREIGARPKLGSTDRLMKVLYNAFSPCSSWDHDPSLQIDAPGGIFNLEFSPDGSLLVAACEKRSVLMFDPLSRQLLHTIEKAHLECVNCVRFLDSRVFATCSDDHTIALWDTRNLKRRIRTLHGHSNWVKNIEFAQSDGLLVTSGFDGAIYTWDVNSYTENGFLYNRVFHTNGLMRIKLNPDATKMIICTTGGYLIVVHNLDLRTLTQDLEGFKPNMYRLMQLSQTTIPAAAHFTHLFSKKRKKNRIEFLTDFPDGDDAEAVSSLQVHPQGWCALSRNISNDENSEWTCVHDIQDLEPPDEDPSPEQSPTEEESESEEDDSGTVTLPAERFPADAQRGDVTVVSTDVWEALHAIRVAHRRRERQERRERRNNGEEPPDTHMRDDSDQRSSDSEEEEPPPQQPPRRSYYLIREPRETIGRLRVPKNHKIHHNVPRLTHYIQETNVGKGIIKELCFSADGRLICSPYGYGVRLLAFSPNCSELSNCVPKSGYRKLREIGKNVCHSDIVVSTKFSPRHYILVTGCLNGRIVWHQPAL